MRNYRLKKSKRERFWRTICKKYTRPAASKDLVDQILTFARQSEEELSPVLMGPIIKEAMKLLRASIPSSIEIRSRIESRSPVMANPINIHQILMNLCSNASYAMQNGGFLEIGVEDARIDSDTEEGAYDLESGKYVKLSVSDNGEGIPKMFSDRFSTRSLRRKAPEKAREWGFPWSTGLSRNTAEK